MGRKKKEIEQINDKLFRGSLKDREILEDIIHYTFPENLRKYIDINSIEEDTTVYNRKNMDFFYSDIVFHCKIKNKDAKIALLFEHKSIIPKYPAIQIGGYIFDIMRLSVNKRNQMPTPIIPIIFYHGKPTWYKRRLTDDLNQIDHVTKPFIPDFDYHLIDLSVYKNDDLMRMFNHKKTRTFMIIFKKDENFIELHFKELVLNLNIEAQKEYFELLYLYLFQKTDINFDFIIQTTMEVSNLGGKIAMTGAERLRKEGEKKTSIKIATNMLKKKMSIEDIVEITGLPKTEVKKLKHNLDKTSN